MVSAEKWSALSSWLKAVADTASAANSRSVRLNSDLAEQLGNLSAQIELYRRSFFDTLPPLAQAALNDFTRGGTGQGTYDWISGLARSAGVANFFEMAAEAIVILRRLDAKMTFALSDHEHQIRSLVERSLTHLDRLLFVDGDVRAKWNQAFDDGERKLEQLGAIHLLRDGIWPFKASSNREETDLVFGGHLSATAPEKAGTTGFVLTEWKRSLNKERDEASFSQARRQAAAYSSGILGGLELRSYRYVVVVSKTPLEHPMDVVENAITYRHINLAINRPSPAKA